MNTYVNSSGLLGKTKDNYDSSGDEAISGEQLIKKTFLSEGGSVEICKGDKIRVIKGDLKGTNGKVTKVEGGFVFFVPTNIDGFTDEL